MAKVKVVKLVFKTENMTLTSLTLTKMTALQRYSVTVLQCYSSEWALRVAALQLKTEGSRLDATTSIYQNSSSTSTTLGFIHSHSSSSGILIVISFHCFNFSQAI